ncbi:SAM-dependent methyltransferase [Brachybacterium endophyticum]|uniref:SAM-dependent methyltransferase n=1 Tax=Brachybacterium endophyticum TaxID=2182385 RepID=A0A2U2RII3_9MICO|nr:SAM-dependent methyltransferase [Brachybacterium endophyticum]PWH05594.1 SAM-dependent methyltransferase [Brachybacterium endophyticum]
MLAPRQDALIARLRAAGSVFAEEEARLLRTHARDPDDLETMAERRVAGEMLEHVIGSVAFGDLTLRIGPGCFVPRRRSRLLARLAVASSRTAAGRRSPQPPVVLEMCAGIAPLLATVHAALPGARLHAADIDPVPLARARENLPGTAQLHRGDLFAGLPADLRGRVDVLVAVPPYVPDSAMDLLPHEVREHEPRRALLGGSDGTGVIARLIDESEVWLAAGGRMLLEMSAGQARDQREALARSASPYTAARVHTGADGHTGVLDLVRAETSSPRP